MPFTAWPVDVDRLVEEERRLIEMGRRSEFELRTITPEDAKEMLDEDEQQREDD